MAYKKQYTLPNGVPLTHFRITTYRLDYATREVSTLVSGYVTPTVLAPAAPVFAKLRLVGERFDATVGKGALAAAEEDVNAILYKALQTDPVICDAGPDFFRDAEPC